MNLTILLIVVGQLFAITDAIGNLPIFYSITKDLDKKERHEAFLTAAIFSFALLIIFMFLGNFILTLVGIQMSDFKIAGGLLILVIAIIILVRGSLFQAKEKIEVGVVPLGCPLLTGPGAITTAMVALATYGTPIALTAVTINFMLSVLVLSFGERICKSLGENGAMIIGRIMTIILAAIAISFIHSGIGMWIAEFSGL